ncbi:MAG: helix-turn-helix transcriptional regulator [Clostridia bacterium]|jgi:transcriptional regulator with XRE-family HTH domain|nr:helix-turn-helix transcriptional regulator [Clostridia bacterium]
MSVKDAVAQRFKRLCAERGITVNELATASGITPSTAYSMLNPERRDVSIITIKKLCDGLSLSLGEFFDAPEFNSLNQEIE